MNTGTTRTVMLGLAVLTLTAGCAVGPASRSDEPSVAYQEDLESAAEKIAEAEKAGAYEHGSDDLNLARDKLNAARRAAADGDSIKAQRLAVEADLDADVALATVSNAEAQAVVDQLHESIQVLENELRRNEERSSTERL